MMGRDAAISAEQLNAAADAMQAEGIRISSRALRERLGSSASLGAISKLLQRRKAGLERRAAAVSELPPVLQQAIFDFVGQELHSAKLGHESELDELQQEATDLATENEAQQATIASQAAELAAAAEELARERAAGQQAQTELAKAQLRLEGLPRLEEAAEAARMELAKAQFRLEGIPRLEEAAELARAELVKAQFRLDGMSRLETDAAALRAALEAEKAELAEVRAELDEERVLRIKAQQFIVDPIFKTPLPAPQSQVAQTLIPLS